MVASGTRKQPSLGELGGAGAREGGSRVRGSRLQTQAAPAAQPQSDQTLRSLQRGFPTARAPHTQLLHLGPSRSAQGEADSPAGPALNLGRGREREGRAVGVGRGQRPSASGTAGVREGVSREASPEHGTFPVPQFLAPPKGNPTLVNCPRRCRMGFGHARALRPSQFRQSVFGLARTLGL